MIEILYTPNLTVERERISFPYYPYTWSRKKPRGGIHLGSQWQSGETEEATSYTCSSESHYPQMVGMFN
jgi:hypothetical protein